MKKETKLIRNQLEKSKFQEHSVPLYLTSSYAFESAEQMKNLFDETEEGYVYSRYSNPNVTEFIDKICVLEEAEAGWATASGMAAVFSTFGALLAAGDHILSCRSIFGSTHKLFTEILPKWKIETTYVPFDDLKTWEKSITPKTKVIYIETPTNPGLDIISIKEVAKMAKKHNLLLVVDNCFATPILQQPILLGADLVIHSATKFIDGQGRTVGGIVVGSNELIKKIEGFARHTGPSLSPFNAWIFSKSLETLPVRINQHCKNALFIAKKLENHPAILWVKYPFLKSHPQYKIAKSQMSQGGSLISFELKGGLKAGKKFLNQLSLFTLTANLGDTRSIATHPASTTHSKLSENERLNVGITDGLVRISVGLEHRTDIWNDLKKSLDKLI